MIFAEFDKAPYREDPEDQPLGTLISTRVVGNRAIQTFVRPDGSHVERGIPTTPLNVLFTKNGLVELSDD